jgi:hypothetical protein
VSSCVLVFCCCCVVGEVTTGRAEDFLFFFFHFLVERIGCSHRFFASFSSLPCAELSHIRYYGFEVPVKSNLWACNIEYDFCGEGQTRRTPALETYAPWHV